MIFFSPFYRGQPLGFEGLPSLQSAVHASAKHTAWINRDASWFFPSDLREPFFHSSRCLHFYLKSSSRDDWRSRMMSFLQDIACRFDQGWKGSSVRRKKEEGRRWVGSLFFFLPSLFLFCSEAYLGWAIKNGLGCFDWCLGLFGH